MIKLENINLINAKEGVEPITYTINDELTYLERDKIDIFKLLSIKQQYIKDGSLTIDDFSLFPLKDQKKYAFVLNINSQVICLNAVFVLELSFKDKTRALLKKELAALREMPLNSEQHKLDKINKIFSILIKFGVSYVLIDGNEQVNYDNKEIVERAIVSKIGLCIVFLKSDIKEVILEPVIDEITLDEPMIVKSSVAQKDKQDEIVPPIVNPIVKDKKEEVKIETKEPVKEVKQDLTPGEKVLQDAYHKVDEDGALLTQTRSVPVVDEQLKQELQAFEKEFETFNLDIAYKKATDKVSDEVKDGGKAKFASKLESTKLFVFMQQIFKYLYLYYIFIALFASFLSICSFSSIYLINNNSPFIAAVLIFIDVVFMIMHLYIIGSTYAGMRQKLTTIGYKLGFMGLYILFTCLGIGIGYGFLDLLSVNSVFVDLTNYVASDWILGLVVSIIAIISPFLAHPLSWAYIKIHDLVKKIFPNQDENK